MLSTLNLKRADPLDQFIRDQEAVAISPAAEESSPAPDAPHAAPDGSVPLRTAPTFTPSDLSPDFSAERLVPRNDTTFRPVAVDTVDVEHQPSIQLQDNSPLGRSMKRAVTGLVIALTGAVATVGWQAYGDDAKQLMERWTTQVPLVSWLHLNHRDGTGPTSQPPVQAADAAAQAPQPEASQSHTSSETAQAVSEQPAVPQPPVAQQPAPEQAASQQAAPSADVSPSTTAPVAAVPSPESQSVQAMAREIATLQRGMEQLKTNQEQMVREIAKLTEQNARRRVPTVASAAPSPGSVTRPAVATPRRPVPPPLQATAQPRPVPPPIIAPPPAVTPPPVQLQQPLAQQDYPVLRPPASVP